MRPKYRHVFGPGRTIISPLALRHYAARVVLPEGFKARVEPDDEEPPPEEP